MPGRCRKWWIRFIAKIPSWAEIKDRRANKVIRFAPYALTVLAAVVSVWDAAEANEWLNWLLKELKPPWIFFAFSVASTSAIISELIYAFRCPQLVKKYSKWDEYLQNGGVVEGISQEFAKITMHCRIPTSSLCGNISHFSREFCWNDLTQDQINKISRSADAAPPIIGGLQVDADKAAAAFAHVLGLGGSLRVMSRGAWAFFFYVAVACWGLPTFIKAIRVVSYIVRHL